MWFSDTPDTALTFEWKHEKVREPATWLSGGILLKAEEGEM